MDEDSFRGIIDATVIAHMDLWPNHQSSNESKRSNISQFVVRYPRTISDDAARGIVETECSLLSERLGCYVSAECLNFDNSCMITIGKTHKEDTPAKSVKSSGKGILVELVGQAGQASPDNSEIRLMQRYNNNRYPPVEYNPEQQYISNRGVARRI